MNLYIISQDINNDYDTYDSAVVCAEDEEDAREIHPSEYITHHRDGTWYMTRKVYPYEHRATVIDEDGTWVAPTKLDKVKVQYIGEAASSVKRGVVLASFNAG